MHSTCKFLLILAVGLLLPMMFVGCGPSKVSSDVTPTNTGPDAVEEPVQEAEDDR